MPDASAACSYCSEKNMIDCNTCSEGYYNLGTQCFKYLENFPPIATGAALGLLGVEFTFCFFRGGPSSPRLDSARDAGQNGARDRSGGRFRAGSGRSMSFSFSEVYLAK